jgi:hypothetical protein
MGGHYGTNRKVAGLIPEEVMNIFQLIALCSKAIETLAGEELEGHSKLTVWYDSYSGPEQCSLAPLTMDRFFLSMFVTFVN